jgi:hypothetical protein
MISVHRLTYLVCGLAEDKHCGPSYRSDYSAEPESGKGTNLTHELFGPKSSQCHLAWPLLPRTNCLQNFGIEKDTRSCLLPSPSWSSSRSGIEMAKGKT